MWLVQGVEVLASVRLRDVLMRPKILDWAARVLGILVVVFDEGLVVCFALPLGVVLVRLTEAVLVIFAENGRCDLRAVSNFHLLGHFL